MTLTALSSNALLLTASYLPQPRRIPLGANQIVACSQLWYSLAQAFAGAPQIAATHCAEANQACSRGSAVYSCLGHRCVHSTVCGGQELSPN